MPLFKTPPPSTSRVLLNQIQDEGGGEGLAPGPRRSTRTRRQRVPFSPSSTPSKTQSQAPARVAVRRSPRIANAAASQPPGLLPRDDDSDVEEDEEDEVFVDAANNVEPPSPHPPHHPPPDGMADLDVDAEAEFWGDHDQLNDDPTGADAALGAPRVPRRTQDPSFLKQPPFQLCRRLLQLTFPPINGPLKLVAQSLLELSPPSGKAWQQILQMSYFGLWKQSSAASSSLLVRAQPLGTQSLM